MSVRESVELTERLRAAIQALLDKDPSAPAA
jgi:hypothetical protein